jgi:hypothetical protein
MYFTSRSFVDCVYNLLRRIEEDNDAFSNSMHTVYFYMNFGLSVVVLLCVTDSSNLIDIEKQNYHLC